MGEETRPHLEQVEQQIKETSRNNKGYELGLIKNLLYYYLGGFRALTEFRTGKISRQELVWLCLVVRGFNSYRCAHDLLQKGYYSQAIMLIRSAEEDYLTCRHCETNEGTIDTLLDGEGRFDRFQEMANDISTEFGKNWRVNYGQLSEIAHP